MFVSRNGTNCIFLIEFDKLIISINLIKIMTIFAATKYHKN